MQRSAGRRQEGAPIIALVVNNGMYGTIRMHQERDFPDRVLGTELRNPDFAALAQSFGAFGAAVTATAGFAPALAAAREFVAAKRAPAVIHLKVDPEAITPNLTLSQIRDAGRKAR